MQSESPSSSSSSSSPPVTEVVYPNARLEVLTFAGNPHFSMRITREASTYLPVRDGFRHIDVTRAGWSVADFNAVRRLTIDGHPGADEIAEVETTMDAVVDVVRRLPNLTRVDVMDSHIGRVRLERIFAAIRPEGVVAVMGMYAENVNDGISAAFTCPKITNVKIDDAGRVVRRQLVHYERVRDHAALSRLADAIDASNVVAPWIRKIEIADETAWDPFISEDVSPPLAVQRLSALMRIVKRLPRLTTFSCVERTYTQFGDDFKGPAERTDEYRNVATAVRELLRALPRTLVNLKWRDSVSCHEVIAELSTPAFVVAHPNLCELSIYSVYDDARVFALLPGLKNYVRLAVYKLDSDKFISEIPLIDAFFNGIAGWTRLRRLLVSTVEWNGVVSDTDEERRTVIATREERVQRTLAILDGLPNLERLDVGFTEHEFNATLRKSMEDRLGQQLLVNTIGSSKAALNSFRYQTIYGLLSTGSTVSRQLHSFLYTRVPTPDVNALTIEPRQQEGGMGCAFWDTAYETDATPGEVFIRR